MDGASRTQLPSDPDQWWQPGPEEEWVSGFDAFADIFSSIGEALAEAFSPFIDAISTISENYHSWHLYSPRQSRKVVVSEALHEALRESGFSVDELEARVAVATAVYSKFSEAVSPIIEATEDHHAVCKHKPRCKKTPAYAALNKSASQARRSKLITR